MIPAGKILKSHGTEGGLLVGGPGADALLDFLEEENSLIHIEFDGLDTPFTVYDWEQKGASRAIIRITDVCTLEDAEELVGKEIRIEGESEEEEDYDFEGWQVFDHGRPAGISGGIEPIPGNPCLYVGDTLVPLHEDFIESVEPEAKILRLNLPEGLLPTDD